MTLFKLTPGHFVVLETIIKVELYDYGNNPPRLTITCSYGAVVRVDEDVEILRRIVERLEKAFQPQNNPRFSPRLNHGHLVGLNEDQLRGVSGLEQPRDGST